MPDSDDHNCNSRFSVYRCVFNLLLVFGAYSSTHAQPPSPSPPALIIPPVSPPLAGGVNQESQLPDHVTQFLKGMTLLLLPDSYSDDDDWGAQKRVQSGLNVRLDGLNLKTSRRWKMVNHGVWQRVDARLVDPEQHFQLAIWLLPNTDPAVPRYRVQADMRLHATGRQQQWSLGAKLYSVSADIVADVSMHAELEFRSQLVSTDERTKLRILPHVDALQLRLQNLNVRRFSHVKGSLARDTGNAFESLAKRMIRRKGAHLAAKINAKIQKKPERFELPAGLLGLISSVPKEAAVSPESPSLPKPP